MSAFEICTNGQSEMLGGPGDTEHVDMYYLGLIRIWIEEGSLVFVGIGDIAASEWQPFNREDAHA